jgi:hypothetical protein
MKLYFIIVSAVIMISGCAKMPVTESSWKSPYTDVYHYTGYDEVQKINWSVRNDSSYLYILVGTSDLSARAKIVRSGMTIFLDTLCRKKGNLYLKCSGTDVPFVHRKDKQDPQQQQQQKPEPFVIKNNISGKFREANMKNGDAEYFIDLRFEKTNLICLYALDTTGYMLCTFGIPLKTIYEFSEWHPGKKLSVGIMLSNSTGKPKPNPGGNDADNYQHGGGMGGSMGGGGMHGGGMSGGGGHGGYHNGGAGYSNSEPGKIWFTTSIAKPN